MKKTLETMFVAGAVALSIAAPVAHAAAGETILRLKAIRIEPDVDSDIPGMDVDGATGGEVGFTGFLSDHWALDLGVGMARHDVTFFGNNGGSVKILPVNLLLQYHFAPNGGIRPYIGAGGNYTHFYDVDIASGLADVDRDRFGPVAQAGLDIPLGKTLLLNLDVKKIWVDTDVSGIVNGNLKLDPWVYGAGLGFRF
ncbi:MAG TPA: OmpW family outer membrane protein [Burkholderiales bacterium]|nr:OmpW family outer membrane protein [Burkholderiales bacterium]